MEIHDKKTRAAHNKEDRLNKYAQYCKSIKKKLGENRNLKKNPIVRGLIEITEKVGKI